MQQVKTERRVRLNATAYEHARTLISEGNAVADERDAWSEHQPSSRQENEFIQELGWRTYARWYLGVNEAASEETKERYEFPYGDFEKVHRCGVLTVESRAAQYDHADIEAAAAHLHGMIDELRARQ